MYICIPADCSPTSQLRSHQCQLMQHHEMFTSEVRVATQYPLAAPVTLPSDVMLFAVSEYPAAIKLMAGCVLQLRRAAQTGVQQPERCTCVSCKKTQKFLEHQIRATALVWRKDSTSSGKHVPRCCLSSIFVDTCTLIPRLLHAKNASCLHRAADLYM